MAVFKRGKKGVYVYQFMFRGQRIERSTKQGNYRVAQQMEDAPRTSLTKGEVGFNEQATAPTLKAFADRFKAFVETNNGSKPETVRFYLGKLSMLLTYEPLARTRLDKIDASEIDAYIQHRSKQVATTTVNCELATLRRLMHVAVEWKVIPAVPKIRLLKGERQRDFVLTPADDRKYLVAAPQPLKDAAVLMLDTGLRIGEAVRLQWADIHLEPVGNPVFGYLRVREGKSKNAKRAVPLTARVGSMLERRKRESTSAWVFPGDNNGSHMPVTSLDHLHSKLRKQLGMSPDFVIHGLRHTMLTRFGEGADAFTIMKIAGHSSVKSHPAIFIQRQSSLNEPFRSSKLSIKRLAAVGLTLQHF